MVEGGWAFFLKVVLQYLCIHTHTYTPIWNSIQQMALHPLQAIALDRQTVFCADRTQDSSKMRGGGLCVYINDAWCSNVVKVDGQRSPDVEFSMLKCQNVCWTDEAAAAPQDCLEWTD